MYCLSGPAAEPDHTGIYDRALQPLGIKANQANILTMLSLTDRATSADIARVLLREKSTVSRTVDRMRKNGWINVAGQGDGPSQTSPSLLKAGRSWQLCIRNGRRHNGRLLDFWAIRALPPS